jgi:methyl-accepting chemotaxis protein
MVVDAMHALRETGVRVIGLLAGAISAVLVIWALAASARVQQLVTVLASLVGRFSDIARQVDTIAQGSDSSLNAVRRINAAMSLLDRGMQQNAAMAEQTSAASVKLLRRAEDLDTQIERVRRQEGPACAPLGRAA